MASGGVGASVVSTFPAVVVGAPLVVVVASPVVGGLDSADSEPSLLQAAAISTRSTSEATALP